MPIDTRSNSGLFRRAEQLQRWEDSEKNQVHPVIPKCKTSKIKFSDECVFLAACAAGDTEEVEHFLEKGTDINTANDLGLTALHQACIGNNFGMVQFLVLQRGCDINRGDNEGRTPLHATASCGFVSIAKFLIEQGANITAVNNDGMLPMDIAESNEMENYLSAALVEQGINRNEARSKEERMMLEDAKEMLNSNKYIENTHPRTGATALHVAASKGYMKVINMLIQLGADLNAQDIDGWTPLHAAAYWGQKEACALLADNLCNMDLQNFAGQTCFSVSEPDALQLLEELKKKQASIQKDEPEIQVILQRTYSKPIMKERTFTTRMSNQEKSKSVMKDTKLERTQIGKLFLSDKETKGEKEKRQNNMTDSLTDTNKYENEIQPKKVSITESKPIEIPKDPELKKISSLKKMLKKVFENSESAGSKISEVTLKSSRKSENDIEKNGSSSDGAKERSISIAVAPLHYSTINAEAVYKSSCDPRTSAIPTNSFYESLSQEKRRSFTPPDTNDEVELRRKAPAKRVCEIRRPTECVLIEDIKSAHIKFLVNTQKETSKSKTEEMQTDLDLENYKDKEKVSPMGDILSANISKKDAILNVGSGDKDKASKKFQLSKSASSERVPPGTLPLRAKSSRSLEDTRSPENQSSLGNQAAIQIRKRPRRRFTGVVYLDSDDGQEEKEISKGKYSSSQSDCEVKERTRHRYKSSTSLPDIASEALSRNQTPSSYTSLSFRCSSKEGENKDYRKLYGEVLKENERLKDSLARTEEELKNNTKQLYKLTHITDEINNYKNSKDMEILKKKGLISEAEKKERGALEQKISELEEELKQYESLKAVSERLQEEKSTLIRVISKLSQYYTFYSSLIT